MAKKRGSVDIQFNWIFVLIAGGIILMFFITVINKQRQISDLRTSAVLATNLESIMAGAQISTNTVNVIDMPQADVLFECDSFSIGPIKKGTKGNVVFAPELLRGRKMIAWARDWSLPFRIANFLYVNDPEIRYIIVENPRGLGQKIMDTLPREMNKELITTAEISQIKDKNHFKVKFVFLGNVPSPSSVPPPLPPAQASIANAPLSFAAMDDRDVTAVNFPGLSDKNSILSSGEVEFYMKSGNVFSAPVKSAYLKEESFYGALFAADPSMYNCEMKKAFQKAALLSLVYSDRSKKMAVQKGPSHPCTPLYRDARIMQLNQLVNAQAASFPQANPAPASPAAALGAIQTLASEIRDQQNIQLQLRSCELIY
ncbi:hypothetical protein HYU14_00310 [Candidatus Woesearchaeota archaeon]|nr:hypothetical protein [Candidatus Woesearchaeota archaeon]